MEILLVVIILLICLIAFNKKIDNIRTEVRIENARYADTLNTVAYKLNEIEAVAEDCIKETKKVEKQSKQITAELKILNYMNSQTVDLKGEVSNEFMKMLKKAKKKPTLKIVTETKKEKK